MRTDGVFAGCFVQAIRDETAGGLEGVRLLPHDGVGEVLGGAFLGLRPAGGELFWGDVPKWRSIK